MQNNDKINSLSVREQARTKLPIWYGSRDNYYHGLREVLNNAVDEISNNFESGEITITLDEDCREISVKDTGRGIPIHKKTDGVPNYQVLFEQFFTSTNYDNADTGKISSGTNGVGTVVLNHTCSLFRIETRTSEGAWYVEYTDGANECTGLQDLTSNPHEEPYGTKAIFILDPLMYTHTKYHIDEVLNIVKHISATSNTITFNTKEFTEEELIQHTYHYEGLKDYFEKNTQALTSKIAYSSQTEREDEGERNSIEAVIATSAEVTQETFLNYNWLKENGSILDGMIQGIRSYMNAYAKEKKLFPKSVKQFAVADIETSFSIMASIHGSNMEFANQTKFSTNKKLYRTIAMQKAKDMLEVHQAENPSSFDKMVKHLLLVQKNNESSRNASTKLKKALSENIESLDKRVDGLVDCAEHGEEAEIYIVEGKSALGSIATARDAMFQAVYPIRGKTLNCLKASMTEILANDIIVDTIKMLGCGVDIKNGAKLGLPPFDMKKLRYGKIIISADADVDGRQIEILLLTMFEVLMPELLRQGKVLIVRTPLYEIHKKDDTMEYIYDEESKQEKLDELDKDNVSYKIARLKGLGEMDVKIMAETAMAPNTRKLVQPTFLNEVAVEEAFKTWMGTKVDNRKAKIETQLNQVISDI